MARESRVAGDRRLAAVLLLAIGIVATPATPAHASLGPPFRIRPVGEPVGAEAGQVYSLEIEVATGRSCDLKDFRLDGPGWSVLKVEAPASVSLEAGGTVRVRFQGVPQHPVQPLTLSFLWEGRRIQRTFDVSTERLEKVRRGESTKEDPRGRDMPFPGVDRTRPSPGPAPEDLGEPGPDGARVATVSVAGAPSLGSYGAPVTIVAFTDLISPQYAQFNARTLNALRSEEIEAGRVRYVLRALPDSGRPRSAEAAVAALCGDRQDRFWIMHDAIVSAARDRALGDWVRMATTTGIDGAAFELCVVESAAHDQLERNRRDAGLIGVLRPQAFIVGPSRPDGTVRGEILVGIPRLDALRHLIEAQHSAGSGGPQ